MSVLFVVILDGYTFESHYFFTFAVEQQYGVLFLSGNSRCSLLESYHYAAFLVTFGASHSGKAHFGEIYRVATTRVDVHVAVEVVATGVAVYF